MQPKLESEEALDPNSGKVRVGEAMCKHLDTALFGSSG